MPRYFDRAQYEALSGPFSEWPLLLCPECHRASLEPSVETLFDSESRAALDGPDWDMEDLRGCFHGFLACPRSPCGNKYVVAGTWEMDYANEPLEGDGSQVEFFSVTYILPVLPLMEYPEDVPDKVRDPIAAASLVILSDPSAAANRIRSAIETLLDCQKVRKYPAGNRSSRLTTHARIVEFADKKPDAATQLMAVKWIGNAGSHEREALPLSLVLDGMEHFARAIELLYDPQEERLRRRAELINQQGKNLRARRHVVISAKSRPI